MKKTDAFARDMWEELCRHKKNGLEWRCAKPIKGGHECVDVEDIERHFLIEVELRRGNPSANVIKVWKWVRSGRVPRDVVLIQAFSGFYRRNGRNDTRQENAEFSGRLMEEVEGVRYIPLSFKYRPRKHGGVGAGRRRKQATWLAKRILRRIKRLRPQ